MAIVKDPSRLFDGYSNLFPNMFTEVHRPGEPAPHAGVYYCLGCGREIGTAQGHPLPPQIHHAHSLVQGEIRWQLLVYADHTAHL